MGTMSAAYMRTYRARLAMSKAEGGLLPFQRRFAEAIDDRWTGYTSAWGGV